MTKERRECDSSLPVYKVKRVDERENENTKVKETDEGAGESERQGEKERTREREREKRMTKLTCYSIVRLRSNFTATYKSNTLSCYDFWK